jgi:tRNA(fMet)-specific endonuclease VapC
VGTAAVNYLLDTNHWSYLQRREAMVVNHIQSLPDETTLYMPAVAQAELLAGVELAVSEPRKQELRTLYIQVITMAADILPITSEVAEQFAHIFANLRRKGRPIDTNDIWIAAIARVHNLVVVTNDEHFQYVDGLQVENWSTTSAPSQSE